MRFRKSFLFYSNVWYGKPNSFPGIPSIIGAGIVSNRRERSHTSDNDSVEAWVGELNRRRRVFTLITETLCFTIKVFY